MAFESSVTRGASFSKNAQARSGNRIKVMIAGQDVGAIQSVRASDEYSPEPVSGIGDIHVIEYVPTMARHNLQVSTMVLSRNSLSSLGITLENGADALRGVTFDIVFQGEGSPPGSSGASFGSDVNTGIETRSFAALRTYSGCSIASCDIEVQKHAIVVSNATINALDVKGNGL